MPSRSQSAILTYRALRMGVVATALLLMTSLVQVPLASRV